MEPEPRIWSFEWTDAMSVGIPEIDEDHKRFIALVDAFNESLEKRAAIPEVEKKLDQMLDDAVQHFAQEARLFAEWNYPGTDHHARMHARLVAELLHFKSTITDDYEAEWVEAGLQIKEALINHIHTEDMKYAEFYRNSHDDPPAGGI